MCEHHFISRLQKMKETGETLYRKEAAISKAYIKYIIPFNTLAKNIRNAAVPSTDRKRLQQLEATNRKLRILLKKEEAAIEKCKQENIKLQNDYQQSIAQALEEEQKCAAYRERLQTLQRITNIHINAKALPNMVQGMIIRDRHHWLPFQYSTNDFDKQQIREMIWSLTQNGDTYNQQWEHLICGTQRSTE